MSHYSNYPSRYAARDYNSSSIYTSNGNSNRKSNSSFTLSPRSYDFYSSSPYTNYTSKYADSNTFGNSSSVKKMEQAIDITPIETSDIKEFNNKDQKPQVVEIKHENQNEPTLQENLIETFIEESKSVCDDASEEKVSLREFVSKEECNETVESEKNMEVTASLSNVSQKISGSRIQNKVPHRASEEKDNFQLSSISSIAKKFGSTEWPPKDERSGDKQNVEDIEYVPKKKVSDLIARFNSGNVNDFEKKTDAF